MWPFSSSAHTPIVRTKLAQRERALGATPHASGSAAVPGRDPTHDRYLNARASEIVARIERGEWTATEVLEAYIARAVFAQATTNCLTEVLFDDARREAELLDRQFAVSHKLKGPLHGVPVSFKDQCNIKGYDSTMGFSKYANQPAATDAMMVELVRAAGGIPIAKTNVPQTLFFFETSNPLWGRTLNPYSPHYSSGGSSGGEAALLAMDGSALGWGTDVGGSLRIPASLCGVYTLKPGWMRLSSAGVKMLTPGSEAIHTVSGPMGRSVDDLELAARIVFGKRSITSSSYEPAPLPFRDVVLPAKLRLGFYMTDDFIKASPACQRAVIETVDALRRAGHECIEVSVPKPTRPMELFIGTESSDGFRTLQSHIGQDPQEPALFVTFFGPRLYGWVRKIGAWFMDHIVGDRVFGSLMRIARVKPVEEYWDLTVQRDEYARLFYDKVWNEHDLDGLIVPCLAVPGLKHGACEQLSALASSTIIYNIVDSPVGVVPVTRVTADDAAPPSYASPPGVGSPLCEKALYKPGGFYNADDMCGLPVAVQVVGRCWEEEKVLGMMRVVDQCLGERGFGPGGWSRWSEEAKRAAARGDSGADSGAAGGATDNL